MWRLFLILVFFVIATSPAGAYSKVLFEDAFNNNLDNWTVVLNAQHEQSDVPCRGKSTNEYTWGIVEDQLVMNISESAPCKSVILPHVLIDNTEDRRISFTYVVDRPDVDRNWVVAWQDKNNYLGFHIFNNTIYAEKYVDGNAKTITPYFAHYAFEYHEQYQVDIP